MTKVYVSATTQDLDPCRQVVSLAVRRLGLEDVTMNAYVAGTQRPLDKCLEDVDRCEIYIGLFAWRYGFVPPGQDRSITELEYRQAVASGKKVLIFLVDEEAPWPRKWIDGGEAGVKLNALRTELATNHICSMFTGPDDLAGHAIGALALVLQADTPSSPVPRPRSTAEATSHKENRGRLHERLTDRYGDVELDALTAAEDGDGDLAIALRSVFVEPYAREDARPEFTQAHRRETATAAADETNAHFHASPKSTRLFDLIADPTHRRMALLGDPGAGKSAVLRYIALSLASDAPDPRLRGLHGCLPVIIELRTYSGMLAEKKCDSFISYLEYQSHADDLAIPEGQLVPDLESGRPVLMMFDGLDEIFDPPRRDEVTNQIAAFASRYPAARVLVTARIGGYSRRRLAAAGFEHFTLEDLQESQIEEFLTRWYAWALPDQAEEADDRRHRMIEAMRNSSAMRELAGNPLLLTILAIIGRDKELPRERWRLYEHAVEVLLGRWDAGRYLPNSDVASVKADKLKLLRRLALRMQTQQSGLNANHIEAEQLIALFEHYLIERYTYAPAEASVVADKLISQLEHRNFILGRYGQGAYVFVHRTFLEYFTALAIVGKLRDDDLEWNMDRLKQEFRDRWADPSWREVLRLIVAEVDPPVAGELINVLTTEANPQWPPGEFVEPPWNLALAVQCLAEVRDRAAIRGVAEALLRQLILLIEHSTPIDDRNTATLIEAEILPAMRVIGTDWPGRQTFVQWYRRRGAAMTSTSGLAPRMAVLLSVPADSIEKFLDKTLGAADNRRAQMGLIAGLAETVALPVTKGNRLQLSRHRQARTLLADHVRPEHSTAVRLAALDVLYAQLGDRDDRAFAQSLTELLRGCAGPENPSAVRVGAIQILGREPADAHHDLLIRLAADEDNLVRRAAVEVLSRRHSGHGRLHEQLVNALTSDTDVGVIQAAGRALLAQPETHAAAMTTLTLRATRAMSDPVHRACVRLLCETPMTADLQTFLRERLHDETDSAACGMMLETLTAGTPDDRQLHGILVDCVQPERDTALRLAAERVLVARFPGAAGTADLLARLAIRDFDAGVRRAAAVDLAYLRGDDATKSLLTTIVCDDHAASVRLAVVGALADQYGDGDDVREVIAKRAKDEDDAVVRLAAVRVLIKLASDDVVCEYLASRVQSDRDPQVLREAASALVQWPRYRPTVLAALAERAASDTYAGIRLAAIDVLVASEPHDVGLRDLLTERVASDWDASVIEAAAAALQQLFPLDPAIKSTLRSRAAGSVLDVRVPAIELLGRYFSGDSAIREWFVGIARGDEDDIAIRRAAVLALAESGGRDEQSRTLFYDLIDDSDWSVRCAVLQALGANFCDDGLRKRLMDLAKNDRDVNFRRVAAQTLTWLPGADPEQLPDLG